MAIEMVKVEVWVVVDQDGDYSVSKEGEQGAGEQYESECVSLTQATVRRIKITVMVPKPKCVELTATLAEEESVGELKVK